MNCLHSVFGMEGQKVIDKKSAYLASEPDKSKKLTNEVISNWCQL